MDQSTPPYAVVATPSGRVVVAAEAQMAFGTAVGAVEAGPFLAFFSPEACSLGVGPWGASMGDATNRGDLPPDGFTPGDPEPAACPASEAEATNGAACPVARGCSYDTTCCICTPTPCEGRPTTWTCTRLGAPDPACPASPPAGGGTCPDGATCNYCLTEGRYFANCTAGGWSVGYAQLLCN